MPQKSMTTTYNTSTSKDKPPTQKQINQKFANAQVGAGKNVIKPATKGKRK